MRFKQLSNLISPFFSIPLELRVIIINLLFLFPFPQWGKGSHSFHKLFLPLVKPGGRIAMTLPVVNTTEKQVSVKLEQMTDGTGFMVFKLLPEDGFVESTPRHQQLQVIPERNTLPERKRGQIVERNVVMLGKA